MRFLLQSATLATLSVSAAARGSPDFRLAQPRRLVATKDPSPDVITENTIRLGRGDAKSVSFGYLEAIRAGNNVDGIYSRLTNGTISLLSVGSGSVFLAPLSVGGQAFNVVVDTGSSDTWLVNDEFTCVDPSDSSVVSEAECAFGPSYSLSSTAKQIPDRNFNISYADGERLNGGIITEEITFGGITVPDQTMGLVTEAGWYGDGVSSGLVGLAYASLTNQYPGTDPAADSGNQVIPYDPIFTTMYTSNLTLPIFSIALDRDGEHSAQSAGGILALGGIPNIPHGTCWAPANISIMGIDAATGEPEYMFYSIVVDGWAVTRSKSTVFDVTNSGTSTSKTKMLGAPTRNTIVDSGTSLIYAPTSVVLALAAAFSPPAAIGSESGLYQLPCDASAPIFGVVIAQKLFYVNPMDLVIQTGQGFCILGVQDNGGSLTILGDVFLRNVIAVFDVGAAQVRFAARPFVLTNGSVSAR